MIRARGYGRGTVRAGTVLAAVAGAALCVGLSTRAQAQAGGARGARAATPVRADTTALRRALD